MKDLGRSVMVCVTVVNWQHSEVIRATRGNKEPEGQAITEENKSCHNAGKETSCGSAAVIKQGPD